MSNGEALNSLFNTALAKFPRLTPPDRTGILQVFRGSISQKLIRPSDYQKNCLGSWFTQQFGLLEQFDDGQIKELFQDYDIVKVLLREDDLLRHAKQLRSHQFSLPVFDEEGCVIAMGMQDKVTELLISLAKLSAKVADFLKIEDNMWVHDDETDALCTMTFLIHHYPQIYTPEKIISRLNAFKHPTMAEMATTSARLRYREEFANLNKDFLTYINGTRIVLIYELSELHAVINAWLKFVLPDDQELYFDDIMEQLLDETPDHHAGVMWISGVVISSLALINDLESPYEANRRIAQILLQKAQKQGSMFDPLQIDKMPAEAPVVLTTESEPVPQSEPERETLDYFAADNAYAADSKKLQEALDLLAAEPSVQKRHEIIANIVGFLTADARFTYFRFFREGQGWELGNAKTLVTDLRNNNLLAQTIGIVMGITEGAIIGLGQGNYLKNCRLPGTHIYEGLPEASLRVILRIVQRIAHYTSEPVSPDHTYAAITSRVNDILKDYPDGSSAMFKPADDNPFGI